MKFVWGRQTFHYSLRFCICVVYYNKVNKRTSKPLVGEQTRFIPQVTLYLYFCTIYSKVSQTQMACASDHSCFYFISIPMYCNRV